jgi:hypothetical protein
MKIRKTLLHAISIALLLLTAGAKADVINPKLEIQDVLAGDTGINLTSTTFDIDASVLLIITDGGDIDIPDLDFKLNSTGSYTAPSGSFAGSFAVDGGTALSGTFSNLTVFTNSLGGQFFADVTYTGGYMAGALSGGRLEGSYTGVGMVAKLGPVSAVPVPAAVWLFGSGLIGMIGIARRRKSARHRTRFPQQSPPCEGFFYVRLPDGRYRSLTCAPSGQEGKYPHATHARTTPAADNARHDLGRDRQSSARHHQADRRLLRAFTSADR